MSRTRFPHLDQCNGIVYGPCRICYFFHYWNDFSGFWMILPNGSLVRGNGSYLDLSLTSSSSELLYAGPSHPLINIVVTKMKYCSKIEAKQTYLFLSFRYLITKLKNVHHWYNRGNRRSISIYLIRPPNQTSHSMSTAITFPSLISITKYPITCPIHSLSLTKNSSWSQLPKFLKNFFPWFYIEYILHHEISDVSPGVSYSEDFSLLFQVSWLFQRISCFMIIPKLSIF